MQRCCHKELGGSEPKVACVANKDTGGFGREAVGGEEGTQADPNRVK